MFAAGALTALALAVGQVAANGGVLSYNIGGQTYNGFVDYALFMPARYSRLR